MISVPNPAYRAPGGAFPPTRPNGYAYERLQSEEGQLATAGSELGTRSVCLVSQVTAADTRAIEAGLNDLWQMAAAAQVGGTIARAASMTLVVPVEDGAQADALVDTLGRLTGTHPLRAVFLILDDSLGEPRARLASHSAGAGESESAPYWEEIRLVAPRGKLRQLMSSINGVALPNLPIQCWWPGTVTIESELFGQLVELSDRVVFDSGAFTDPAAALGDLRTAIIGANETVGFADLNWTRLTPWRGLLAEVFDEPTNRAMLDSVERVTVEYPRDSAGGPSQAMLVCGWLASRLGWEPRAWLAESRGAWRFTFVDGLRPVNTTVVKSSANGVNGARLNSVGLEAHEDERAARFSVSVLGDEAVTMAEIDGHRAERRAYVPPPVQISLLRDELGGFATDRIYFEAIASMADAFACR